MLGFGKKNEDAEDKDAEASDDSQMGDEEQDRLLKQFRRQLDSAEKHAKEINAEKDRAHKVYLGESHRLYGKQRDYKNPRDWRSRRFPKIIKEHVELKVAELCDSPPEFDVVARFPEFEEVASATEKAVAHYLDMDEWPRKHRISMRSAVKYGSQPVKIVMMFDPYLDKVRPTIIPLAYEDFLPQPGQPDISKMSYCFHRWKGTINDLRAVRDDDGEPFYSNLDDLLEGGSGDSDAQQRPDETSEAFEARRTGLHTIHERWTPHGMVAVANKSVIIRVDENADDPIFEDKQVPFEVVRIVESEVNLDGSSVVLDAEEGQSGYWKFYNELVDAVTMATRPPKLVDEELDQNAAKYDIYPDAKIPTRGGESSVKIMQDVASLTGYNMQSLIQMERDHVERQTGMNSTVAGIANSGSATQSSNNLSQAKSRTRLEVTVSDDDWGRVVRKYHCRIMQYCDDEDVLRASGGVDIKAPEARGLLAFRAKVASSRVLREQRQNSLTTLWNAIMPMIQPGTVEFEQVDKLLKELVSSYDVIDIAPVAKSQQQAQLDQAETQLQIDGQSMQQQMELQQQMAPPPAEGQAPA